MKCIDEMESKTVSNIFKSFLDGLRWPHMTSNNLHGLNRSQLQMASTGQERNGIQIKFLTCGKRRGLFLVFQLLMVMMSTISTMPVPVMMMATVIIVLTLAATHDVSKPQFYTSKM